jgi:hypothetical protein
MRGLQFGGTIAAQVPITKIIGVDDDDIRFFLRLAELAQENQQGDKELFQESNFIVKGRN